jgi:glycosyltransferase involved in cell wall biosynthesis
MSAMAKIKLTIGTPCYQEELNARRCYEAVKKVMEPLSDRYEYEHIFGDNGSTDGTAMVLKQLAAEDPRVKVLLYARNFGVEKSVMTLYRHAMGAAVILISCDLQDDPEAIPRFIAEWEKGAEVVSGTYINRSDSFTFKLIRKLYYWLIQKIANEPLIRDFSGYALLDRKVVDSFSHLEDFSPYVRGLIAAVGFRVTTIPYVRLGRDRGRSSYNFAQYLGTAMNAIISHSIVPIRLATFAGLFLSGISILMAFVYAVIKILNWNFQAPGATTVVVLLLFFSGIQLFFLGVLGEYIGATHSQVRPKPFVVIREKINFAPDEGRGESVG